MVEARGFHVLGFDPPLTRSIGDGGKNIEL